MFIDWLTLRISLHHFERCLFDRFMQYAGRLVRIDSSGKVVYEKIVFDVEKLRSDSPGLFWQIASDGSRSLLVIAGSPANVINNFSNNVFGSCDVRYCSQVMIGYASRCLDIPLPLDLSMWECRRIDVTANYYLPGAGTADLAISQLLFSESARKRSSSPANGGKSVYWGGGSTRSKGKAYLKGEHARYLARYGKAFFSDSNDLSALDHVIRFEHTRGSAFFRDLESGKFLSDESKFHCDSLEWHEFLSVERCEKLFLDYFSQLVSNVEVSDMKNSVIISLLMARTGCSESVARSSFNMLRNIREDGFDVVKNYMSHATFYRYMKILRDSGITESDIRSVKIIPVRKIKIDLLNPVRSWDELRAIHAESFRKVA